MDASKFRTFLFFLPVFIVPVSCGDNKRTVEGVETETIDYYSFSDSDDASELDFFFQAATYQVLGNDPVGNPLFDADKFRSGASGPVAMNWRERALVAYPEVAGEAPFPVGRFGRGPGEYLQADDFALAQDGSIYVLDGRQDCLIHYSEKGFFLGKKQIPFEAEHFYALPSGKFLWGLASWDSSSFKGHKVLLTDSTFKPTMGFLDYGDTFDPSFGFPSNGFLRADGQIFFSKPIADETAVFSLEGDLLKMLRINFGPDRVEDAFRSDIESHLDKINGRVFLVNTPYWSDRTIVMTIREKGVYRHVLLHFPTQRRYYLDKFGLQFIGFDGDSIFFNILDRAKAEECFNLPPVSETGSGIELIRCGLL